MVKMQPEVDVLLATYNGENYLPELLASLKAQDSIHILYQDDGSQDGTLALLKNETRVELPHEKGPKGNFLSLLKATEAPYAMFSDQDDIWEKDKTALCLQKMREAEKQYGESMPLLVHTDLCVVDENNNVLHPSLFAHQRWDSKANTLNRLLVQNNATGCTMMLNRPLMALLLKADSGKVYMHDWWAALTAAAFGRVLFVDKPTVRYRQHGANKIGASQDNLHHRAVKALGQWEKGKNRVALTYQNAQAFYDCYHDMLPRDSKGCLTQFLAIPTYGKLKRVQTLERGGFRMQSRVTRLGHYLFC